MSSQVTSTRLPTCYRHPDRETGLSCSECGRPICTECMTPAAVGLRCPDHAGNPRLARTVQRRGIQRAPQRLRGTEALVTKALIAVNVAIYLITAVQGNGINAPGGTLFAKMFLFGPAVAQGDWWRLITAAFLHASVLHIGFNMLALWWIGAPVEQYLGRVRYLGLYLVSGLAGSAGALVLTPTAVTVGASGAIFGILGAMLILEWQTTGRLAGNATTLIVIHLGISPGEKAIRTIAVYLALLVLLHLSGKRSIAQLNSFDLVVLLLLSNVVQNAIIGDDLSLAGGLLGAAILVAANYVLVHFAF